MKGLRFLNAKGAWYLLIKRCLAPLGFLLLAVIPAGLAEEAPSPKPPFSVFRGVTHIHTIFSNDSIARLDFIIETARQKGWDFVMITDHNSMKGADFYQKMREKAPPLMIFGNEISAADGHLIMLGVTEPFPDNVPSQILIDWIHERGGYVILPHPFGPKNPWKNWEVTGWDGLEIFNFGHNLFLEGGADFAMASMFGDPREYLEGVQKIPQENWDFWDGWLQKRTVAATGGTDAHLKKRPESFLAALDSVTMFVIAGQLEEKEIVKSVVTGKSFMAFETRGEAKDFMFWAESGGRTFKPGETVQISPGASVTLRVHVPMNSVSVQVLLVHNGVIVAEEETQELTFEAKEPGAYRVEVYLGENLWIFSNPLYLKS